MWPITILYVDIFIEQSNQETTLDCSPRRKTCNNHGNGLCTDYCSNANFCGKEPIYKPINGGTDCRGCDIQSK